MAAAALDSEGSNARVTYPPDHHLLRDLRVRSEWINDDECIFTAPVVPEICLPNGDLRLGPLFAVVDVALVATAIDFAEDDWCGTLDLAIRMRQPVVEGPLVLNCQVMRIGGTLITTQADIYDGQGSATGGTLAGRAIATSRRMPRNPEYNDSLPEPKMVGAPKFWGIEGSGFTRDVHEQLDLVEIRPGVIELVKTPYVTNSFGTVNGGTTGILICAAAESALGEEFVATDFEARYIGQAKEGPVQTMTEVIRVGRDHAVVDVTVMDMGRERRPIATGGITLTTRSA